MQRKRFSRTKENFVCGNCQKFVQGNGYTDHCPRCLWSRHVDVFPGDRQSTCKGFLQPLSLELRGQKTWIHYICLKCHVHKRNQAQAEDSFEALLKLSTHRTST